MFIRGRFCWTSPDKNELMSLLARAGARFFPHKQHNTARGRRGNGGKEGRGKRKRRRELFAINCYNKNISKHGLFYWKGSQCLDINRQKVKDGPGLLLHCGSADLYTDSWQLLHNLLWLAPSPECTTGLFLWLSFNKTSFGFNGNFCLNKEVQLLWPLVGSVPGQWIGGHPLTLSVCMSLF